MRVAVGSDFHNEFSVYKFDNTEADVLVLGGDILLSNRFNTYDPISENTISDRFHTFLNDASEHFKDVIYIMGNHEHYDGDFAQTEKNIRECMKRYTNIHFLEKETIKIGDVAFVGGTMWTDMNKRDDLTMMHVQHRMNDFQIIKNSNTMVTSKVPTYKRTANDDDYVKDEKGFPIEDGWKMKEEPSFFNPEDAADDFDKFFGYLKNVIQGKHDEKFFVCTHHAPSRQSTKPYYRHDYMMNGAYSTELDEFIMDHPQIKVWTHGHTHEDFDYMIGETRIVCNPRGYVGYERRASEFQLKVIEL